MQRQSAFESCVEGKAQQREIAVYSRSSFQRPQNLTSSDQLCLCKKCTIMGDLKEAPAVHFNFPLLSFSLHIAFKSGLPLPVSLFLWNRGGLVIAAQRKVEQQQYSTSLNQLFVQHKCTVLFKMNKNYLSCPRQVYPIKG